MIEKVLLFLLKLVSGKNYTYDDIRDCLHRKYLGCKGTSRKQNGEPCIYMISCSCPKCNIGFLG